MQYSVQIMMVSSGPPNTIRVLPPPKPCVDTAANCPQLIGVCTDPLYEKWAIDNCPRYCNWCIKLLPKGEYPAAVIHFMAPENRGEQRNYHRYCFV